MSDEGGHRLLLIMLYSTTVGNQKLQKIVINVGINIHL